MKTCSSCHTDQPLAGFYTDSRRADGRQSQCKSCKASRYGEAARVRAGNWYRDNPERHTAGTRRRREANRERYLAQTRDYHASRIGNRDPLKPWPDECSYNAAHLRTKSTRGKAKDHACIDCGNSAVEWSYNHSSAKELAGLRAMPRSRDRVVAYSPDPDDYDPRCKSCHVKFDARDKVAA